ncbi:EAL domain-containing protein [Pseudaquabacterium terrae]|uniref:sensor domain-containing protein n=1 Tax=Pseudaquabacterium terrae TaxID=2732868 RepID=UPI001FE3BC6E|nr:EAL domain-containing protein [Aquabacterium terrae]
MSSCLPAQGPPPPDPDAAPLHGVLHSLRDSEARFRDLTAMACDWYWEQDAALRFIACTGAESAAPVWHDGRHAGLAPWQLPGATMSDEVRFAQRAAQAARLPFHDLRYQRRDDGGGLHVVSISGRPIVDEQGRFRGYRGIARDITERTREESLLRLEHAVARCLADADDVGVALKTVIQAICETEGWEYGRYWRADDAAGVLRFAASWCVPGSLLGPHMQSSEGAVFAAGAGMVGRAWATGQPLWVADLTQRKHVLQAQLGPGLNLHGASMFPVISQGRGIGVMSFVSRVVREPEPRLLEAFSVIGGQIGLFLQRKQREDSLRESEARFERQALQQGLIAAFGQQALANVGLEALLEQASKAAAAGLGVDRCDVLLRPQASEGAFAPVSDGALAPVSEGELPQLQGASSAIEAPISGRDGDYGVLAALADSQREFPRESHAFLQSLANALATAMDRHRTEVRLTWLAQFDPLTGLPNRSLLMDRLGQALAQAQRHGWIGAVLFIDLDRFKMVNDTLGHKAGDELLIQAAQRLKECVRASDTVARLGGDEFAAVLSQLTHADDAAHVAQKIIAALSRPFVLDGQAVHVSASIGIALYPRDGDEADLLLRNADTAMYRAKEQGRNASQGYLPAMNEQAPERLQLQTELRGALERREFVLQYQPKICLATGALAGFEALLRWQHPVRGLVPPLRFIPSLEETGLIIPVGEWVVRTVCEQLAAWQAAGMAVRPVAINLSARQFQQRELDATIGALVRASGIDAGLIELELTESMLMSDPEAAARTLRNLRSFGVRLSVDDFGTGYSSLSHLKRFALDTLKIDRTFVRDVTVDADDAAITVAIIELAHRLKLKVVAEGVETREQLDFLRAHQCDEVQGFYFAKPMTADDCVRLLVGEHSAGVMARWFETPPPDPPAGPPAPAAPPPRPPSARPAPRSAASSDRAR